MSTMQRQLTALDKKSGRASRQRGMTLVELMVGLIGGLMLGEGLGARRIAAVVVAVAGGLIVLRPGVRELSLGHLSQLGATVFFAMSYIIAKRLSREAPASVLVAVLSVTVTVGLLPLAVWQWQPVGVAHLVEPWVLAGGGLIILAISANTWAEARRDRVAPVAADDL